MGKSDPQLAGLLNNAIEYAQVCVLAKQTYIGYEGMSKLATIKGGFYEK